MVIVERRRRSNSSSYIAVAVRNPAEDAVVAPESSVFRLEVRSNLPSRVRIHACLNVSCTNSGGCLDQADRRQMWRHDLVQADDRDLQQASDQRAAFRGGSTVDLKR